MLLAYHWLIKFALYIMRQSLLIVLNYGELYNDVSTYGTIL